MNNFKFKNPSAPKRTVALNLEGTLFDMELNAKLSETLFVFHKRLLDLASEDISEKEKEKKSLKIGEKAIDAMLGKSAFSCIFKNRTPSLYDFVDIVEYIVQEVKQINGTKGTENSKARKS